MAERTLVDAEVEAAKRLVAFLDAHGFPVKAALWLYETEAERWRFVVSFQERRDHPVSFYRDIAELVHGHEAEAGLLGLDRVSFVDADRSIVQTFVQRYRGMTGNEGRHVVGTRLPGVYVEEALILRLPA